MNHKFSVNELVVLKIGERTVETKILEKIKKAEGKLFYKVDWEICGYNKILNTVAISETAIEKACVSH
jgi:hypothetical protein